MAKQSRLRWGAVRELPSGRFQARYPLQGRLVPADITFASRTEACIWLTHKEVEISKNLHNDPRKGRQDLDTYFASFLTARVQPLRASSLENYRETWRLHISPFLGSVPLASLTKTAVKEWLGALSMGGRSEATRTRAFRILRSMLYAAVDDGILAVNPAKLKRPPNHEADERPVCTPAQALLAADLIDPRYRAMVFIGFFVGLRLGECMALTPRKIDLLHNTVRVDQRVYTLAGGVIDIGPPKTRAGVRTLPIPDVCRQPLLDHLATFCDPGRDSLVFTRPGRKPLSRQSFAHQWSRVRDGAGLPSHFTFHDLRHSGNTWAARIPGITIRDLMVRLGHSDPAIAMKYMHSSDEQQQKIADALSALAAVDIPVVLSRD